jgi:hypothetical protein
MTALSIAKTRWERLDELLKGIVGGVNIRTPIAGPYILLPEHSATVEAAVDIEKLQILINGLIANQSANLS